MGRLGDLRAGAPVALVCLVSWWLSSVGEGARLVGGAPFFWPGGPPWGNLQASPCHLPAMASSLLTVPFASQLDNASGQGWRECFTSSCAMVAMYWGKVRSDDEFSVLRTKHGDSTNVSAQLATLRGLGLRAHFWQTGRRTDLTRMIQDGRPVAVGWLHRGHVSSPRGGHWSVIVGVDEQGFWMHDPFGEPLLASGGHISGSSGRSVRCGWSNFLRRWHPEGEGRGWFIDCRPVESKG